MRKHLANSSREVQERLLDREEFIGSNFYGTRTPPWSTGRMPSPWEEIYKASRDLGVITYVVMSYATPIAWVTGGGEVHIPDVKYSPTTTRHQSYLRGLLPTLSDRARADILVAAQTERRERERATASARQDAREYGDLVPLDAAAHARQAHAILHSRPSVPRPGVVHKPVRRDYAPVRMEYSESYSVRQGWATSYVDGPASQVGGYATWGSNE